MIEGSSRPEAAASVRKTAGPRHGDPAIDEQAVRITPKDIWERAFAIVEAYGDDAAGHVLRSFDDQFAQPGTMAEWRGVALAVDAILACRMQ